MPIAQIPVTCPGVESGLRITKGDTKSVQIGLGIDLTGFTVTLTVKRSPTSPDFYFSKFGTILAPPTAGNVQFDFIPDDTSGIPAGFYIFNVTTTDSLNQTQQVFTGQFIIDPVDQSLVGKLEPIMTLGLTGATERLSLEVRDKDGVLANPLELSLQVLDPADNPIIDIPTISGIGLINPQAGIFLFDLTSNRAGDYLAIWTTRFVDEEPIKTIKNIRFVTPTMFRMIPEILLYIDKSRKATNKPIAFTSIDVAEYIQNALRDFNATTPTTEILLEEVNEVYKEVLVQGSVIQALIAQGLLAVDQDFQYNDNGISLSIDHNTKLMGWYQALLQSYIAKKGQYKMNYFQPHAMARTIVGTAFALGFAKIPAGSAARFRGWI